jgi:hypothetical protein
MRCAMLKAATLYAPFARSLMNTCFSSKKAGRTEMDLRTKIKITPDHICAQMVILRLLLLIIIHVNSTTSIINYYSRNLRNVLHILSRHKDVLSIHLLLSFKTGPSYVVRLHSTSWGTLTLWGSRECNTRDGAQAAYLEIWLPP